MPWPWPCEAACYIRMHCAAPLSIQPGKARVVSSLALVLLRLHDDRGRSGHLPQVRPPHDSRLKPESARSRKRAWYQVRRRPETMHWTWTWVRAPAGVAVIGESDPYLFKEDRRCSTRRNSNRRISEVMGPPSKSATTRRRWLQTPGVCWYTVSASVLLPKSG